MNRIDVTTDLVREFLRLSIDMRALDYGDDYDRHVYYLQMLASTFRILKLMPDITQVARKHLGDYPDQYFEKGLFFKHCLLELEHTIGQFADAAENNAEFEPSFFAEL